MTLDSLTNWQELLKFTASNKELEEASFIVKIGLPEKKQRQLNKLIGTAINSSCCKRGHYLQMTVASLFNGMEKEIWNVLHVLKEV